jgi:mycothiol synthase
MLAGMTAVLPSVRPLTTDDVDAMVDLATLCEIAETGEPDPELVEWIENGAGADHFHAIGIDDESGLAAFGYVECFEGHAGLEADVRVRPGLRLDTGSRVLEAVRRIAADFDPTKPIHIFANSSATAQRRWLEEQGGTEIRHFWRMAIDLPDAAPDEPAIPDGIVVRRARDEDADLRRIFAVVDTSFAEHFGHLDGRTYERWIELWRMRGGFDLSLWWVAELDGEPVSALLGSIVRSEHAADNGHVNTLGTLKQARGRGLGTLLLRTAFREFHARGLRRVTLGVDSENGTGAVHLYETVGMRAVADWPLYEFPPLAIAE